MIGTRTPDGRMVPLSETSFTSSDNKTQEGFMQIKTIDGRVLTIPDGSDITIEAPDTSVNHPKHYNTGNIEVIDFIEDQNLGFHLGNVVKYLCRREKATTLAARVQDLQKAKWYLERHIEKILKEKYE